MVKVFLQFLSSINRKKAVRKIIRKYYNRDFNINNITTDFIIILC